jgi:hypothetical protein
MSGLPNQHAAFWNQTNELFAVGIREESGVYHRVSHIAFVNLLAYGFPNKDLAARSIRITSTWQ